MPTRKPANEEIQNCLRYESTSSDPWDPTEILSSNSKRGPNQEFNRGPKQGSNREPRRGPDRNTIGRQAYAIRVLGQRLNPPELMYDHIISSLDSLDIVAKQQHEADVLAHEEELRRSQLSAVSRDHRQCPITDEDLAKRWHIGIEAAKRTLQTMTQNRMRFVRGRLERRLRTSQAHLRYPVISVTIYFDTMFPGIKSIRGYTCAQVFTDGHGFTRVYLLKKKAEAYPALVRFIQDVGIPKSLLTDNAPEETRGEWGQVVRKYHIKPRMTEPSSPWQNRAEAEIREIKKLACQIMKSSSSPLSLWCYALEWAARVRSMTALDLPFLETRTPEERITS